MQHLNRGGQVHQWARLSAEQPANQQSQARAKTFPTGGNQLGKGSFEWGAVCIHSFEE
jgi:hypothetical protein